MKSVRLFVLGATLFAAGCAANYTAIDAAKPVTIGDNVSVIPQIAWAQAPRPGVSGTVWTADGVALDALMFFPGVAPGQPLIQISGVDQKDLHVYRTDMVPDDVMELLTSNFGKLGYQQIRTSNLRPAPFGQTQGFRFDITFSTQEGLAMKGMAIAAQRGGKLDLIIFMAPGEYYFGRYSDTVERIFSSIQAS
jgi:hypothetical protein